MSEISFSFFFLKTVEEHFCRLLFDAVYWGWNVPYVSDVAAAHKWVYSGGGGNKIFSNRDMMLPNALCDIPPTKKRAKPNLVSKNFKSSPDATNMSSGILKT